MKINALSPLFLALATTLAAAQANADGGHRQDHRYEYGAQRHHDHGLRHHGQRRHHAHRRHHGHHRDHDRHSTRIITLYRHGQAHHDEVAGVSSAVIVGSVIGGVVGSRIGNGDPDHTAAGALIGTLIGYDIARQHHR